MSRKRGLELSYPEMSHTNTTFASSSGYLDRGPPKYRELAEASGSREDFQGVSALTEVPAGPFSFVSIPIPSSNSRFCTHNFNPITFVDASHARYVVQSLEMARA